MEKRVRVRFAPSPTGGLHLGGVRTVLYNYLFARHHGGDFILRIEDTDQTRFVPGAEQYLTDCLTWCGLTPDESPEKGGAYGPYRQSERKAIYHQYAEQLVQQGNAYYAFDTPEALEAMREQWKTNANPSPTYNYETRLHMKNSLTLPANEVEEMIKSGVPYVVRIKMPDDETIVLEDAIRGEVSFHSQQVDDKVLLKADGMPTYHLAVVVDDYKMKITHAFRGEEWLSSAPVHLLLWKYLGWQNDMPQWAHLPLILGPDGAKLSKRHGNKYGFPIFAMRWHDVLKNETTDGFREMGFLPEAFVNLLALMGWNDGTGAEIMTLETMVKGFSLERVHSAGAQFDFEKAKWFNHQWIKRSAPTDLLPYVKIVLQNKGLDIDNDKALTTVITLVKDRCTLLTDFYQQGVFFYQQPQNIDIPAILPKWNEEKILFFDQLQKAYFRQEDWHAEALEQTFKNFATDLGLKPGDLMLPLRIMLVGGKYGPGVFDIAAFIGKAATLTRIKHTMDLLAQ